MDLARLGIALRPRSHWEAIDLGFAMAQRWFVPLCKLWLLSALPVALVLLLLFNDNLLLTALLVWWGKPLYEPPLIYWLSRAAFGERPTLSAMRQQWWRIVRPRLFANLTLRRFDTNRSFYMPVALLEGLKGKERRQRLGVLGHRQQAGTWLTVVGIHFETILETGFLLTIYFLVPEELRWFDDGDFFFVTGSIDTWIQFICSVLAMALIAPFYVAAGFALYLHRRSELEGWDIEISFRRTVERSSSGRSAIGALLGVMLFTLLLGASVLPDTAMAEPGPEQSKQVIEQVLTDPLFGRMEEQTHWRYVGDKEKKKDSAPEGLMALLEFLFKVLEGFITGFASLWESVLWGAVLFTVVYLLHHYTRNRSWMQMLPLAKRGQKRVPPSKLFGLDVRPESLPDDVAEAAMHYLRSGDLRVALSLLYRGTLVRLITEHQLDIPDSATEGECLHLVHKQRGHDEAAFFRRLTRLWLRTAYAHVVPPAEQVEQLCRDWQQVYGHVTV